MLPTTNLFEIDFRISYHTYLSLSLVEFVLGWCVSLVCGRTVLCTYITQSKRIVAYFIDSIRNLFSSIISEEQGPLSKCQKGVAVVRQQKLNPT